MFIKVFSVARLKKKNTLNIDSSLHKGIFSNAFDSLSQLESFLLES